MCLKFFLRKSWKKIIELFEWYPLKFQCWSPNIQCAGVWRWGHWGIIIFRWSRGGGALVLGLVPLQKTPGILLTQSAMWRYGKTVAVCKPGRELLPPWSWTSPPLEIWEINVSFLSHPVYGILLWELKQARTRCWNDWSDLVMVVKIFAPFTRLMWQREKCSGQKGALMQGTGEK